MKTSILISLCSVFLGVIISFFITAYFNSIIVDNHKIQSAQAIQDTLLIRNVIENELLNEIPISDYFYRNDELHNISSLIKVLYRGRGGNLIMKLSNGTLIWFYPERKNGAITWHCFGGSNRDIPISCREEQGKMVALETKDDD